MFKNVIVFYLFVIFVLSCSQEYKLDAKVIIDKSIKSSGTELVANSTIQFDFRDKFYFAKRYEDDFLLARISANGSDSIVDLLSNEGFERAINDEVIHLEDSMASKYSSSVNSVHYFSVLPYGLNDAAVNKTYMEDVMVKGTNYHKIKVTFNQAGGGEDFEDEFIYYINSNSFKIDYLSYSYNEDDGKGLRFREAYNERYIKGIRFVDYKNYKPKNKVETLENMERLFEKDSLELLSKIELKNIKVIF
jgi:hypothetical protein